MTRARRPVVSDATYFVTAVTHRREPWFARPPWAQMLVDQLRHYQRVLGFQLHAFCVMPDHYHAVVTPAGQVTLSRILHAVNSYTAHCIGRQLGAGRHVRIWQRRAWDVVIRNDSMYWHKIAYTLLNPWRAGLAPYPLAPYPYSDLEAWVACMGEAFVLELFGWHLGGRAWAGRRPGTGGRPA